ncbi:MAG: acetate/propionate family kinase [Nanoarchaeota archaeon]|nr:acetate/propionate family kinase [Nanoarchaeota archaeon]
MNILILNVGSSSIKYVVFKNKSEFLKGKIERIGLKNPYLRENNRITRINVRNFSDALNFILKKLKDVKINIIGHRIVHGGDIKKVSLVNDKLLKKLKKVAELAPLHDYPELKVIESCKKLKVKQYAVFDTSFHQTLKEDAYTYALPYQLCKKYGIRRYGFHGESHNYMSKEASRILKRKNLKLITLHLGNGCSVCAINNGKSVDTSMGFTPLEGLVMGTRCGNIDPSIPFFLIKHEKIGLKEMGNILNKKSGLLGISGVSRNIKDLEKLKDKKSKLAIDVFVYNILKYIGAYYVVLNGLDALVFAGGIGENEHLIRKKVLDKLKFLKVKIDQNLNKENNLIISKKNSKVKVLIVKTNEEKIILNKILGVI